MGPTFASDLGLVLGWENPYLVPFLHAGGFVAEPLDRAPVHVHLRNDDGTTRLRTLDESRGVGIVVTAGVRVPLQTEDPHVRVSVLAAFVFTGVWGAELSAPNDFLLLGGTGGLEVAFEPSGLR